MGRHLERVVVLGAGTMGARVAAHCANHGLDATLLDQTREQAEGGLRAARQGRPAAFFLPELGERIRTGSFDERGDALARADWVLEAIVEDLASKRELLRRIAPQLGPRTLLTTNTSGLPVAEVGAALPADVQARWLGTHFFNPPRYMRLVEIIPGPATEAPAAQWLAGELEVLLGKGVVAARDTPNFIANRIGLFALMNTLRLMEQFELSVEDVDALTGPVMGWPKSATFRTMDLIGLDTLLQVIRNSHARLAQDESRDLFQAPAYLEELVQRQWLGDKTGQGFYKREGDAILAIDLKTLHYHPRRRVQLPFTDTVAAVKQSPFLARAVRELIAYCERRLGEITDDPAAIDQAMQWGYNWKHGPFALRELAQQGRIPEARLGRLRRGNRSSSVLELSDNVGCLELHNRNYVLGAETVMLVREALEGDWDEDFDAWVLTSNEEHFSYGADLAYLLALMQNQEWEEIDEAVRQFQAATRAVKHSRRPVVVAPAGMALGGGCELMLHAARVVAHAELYAGLVEAGVGLIPAGGGTKELALRCDPKFAFETIGLAKVSTSAAEARSMKLLRDGDMAVASRGRVVEAARQAARQMVYAGYEPPTEGILTAPGPSVESTLRMAAFLMREAGQITEFEQKIAGHLIHVLCAGGAPAGSAIPEARLLELEREAFLSLCGEARTQQRISHRLRTGQALRN
jgi:3-hydroxyacyl-CoA dehydrogenase